MNPAQKSEKGKKLTKFIRPNNLINLKSIYNLTYFSENLNSNPPKWKSLAQSQNKNQHIRK